jgi:hypothetical protein
MSKHNSVVAGRSVSFKFRDSGERYLLILFSEALTHNTRGVKILLRSAMDVTSILRCINRYQISCLYHEKLTHQTYTRYTMHLIK